MKFHFTKMHGLGNDFVVIDAVNHAVTLSADVVRQIADRRRGIGCDQVLLVEKSRNPAVDFHYRIFNADGYEVGQCGNGARCLAQFIHEQGLSDKTTLVVSTQTAIVALERLPDGQIKVNMGEPRFAPADIPLQVVHQQELYAIELAGQVIPFGACSLGNPHAVIIVNDVVKSDVTRVGELFNHESLFPEGVNVGFMQILSPSEIHLRVFERGVGETYACGSGACAAVVIGRLQEQLAAMVRVRLPGGELQIEWQGPDHPVYMIGPAATVFAGEWLLS